MAGITKDGVSYRVQFTFNGKRRRLRLKGHNKRQAEAVAGHIDALIVHKVSGQVIDIGAAKWLGSISEDLHAKLAEFGLVAEKADDEPEQSQKLTAFVARFVDRGRKLKDGMPAEPNTLKKWRTTQRYLADCFGDTVDVDKFTASDAIDFRDWLENQAGIKRENTIRKHCQIAQMFFNAAIDDELCDRNPFRKLPTTSQRATDRQYHVTREEFDKCVAACPDHQWEVILYLCRVAGMRCPTEVVAARFSDIDWKGNRMDVHCVKTAGHEGRDIRQIPLFPELRDVLQKAWELAPKGEDRIVTRYTRDDQNLRTTFEKVIKRAGLKPWPRLFQNMRASRENELIDQGVRADVAASWMGHSPKTQEKSYLNVSDHHFDEALNL